MNISSMNDELASERPHPLNEVFGKGQQNEAKVRSIEGIGDGEVVAGIHLVLTQR